LTLRLRQRPALAHLATGAPIVVAYFLAARLGLSLAFRHQSVTPVWPPTGVAISALLLLGRRYWPAVFLGAFLANEFTTSVGPVLSLGIAIGNTLEAVTAEFLILWLVGSRQLPAKIADAGKFLLLACLVAPAASATIGNLALCLGHQGRWTDFPALWLTWWIGDGCGALIFCPWILSLQETLARLSVRRTARRLPEFLLLTTVTVGIASLAFGPLSFSLLSLYPPIIVWAATRFTQLAVSNLILLISMLTIWATLHGHGQFAFPDSNLGLLLAQVFIATLATTGQFVLALFNERKLQVRRLTEGESQLVQSERRFQQLAQNIREVFYIFDVTAKRFEYISPAFDRIWGRESREFCRNPELFFETLHPEDRDSLRSTLQRQWEGEETSVEYRVVRPDGRISWIWDRGVPITDAQGVSKVVGIAEDFTLRKEIEQELRKKADQLARANRDLQNFASVASHDLKAPLRNISSFLGLLQRNYGGKLDAEADEFIEFTRSSCARMSRLIDDLLKDAQIGGKLLELGPVDLRDAVGTVIEDLRSLVREASAQIDIGHLPAVQWDPTQLRELLQNLVVNAIKFRRAEPPRIAISARREPAQWVVSVADNGVGISPDYYDRIFDSLVRIKHSSHSEGSGIGLSTCKRIVEKRGGRIWVESREGEGSTFFFSIPDHFAPEGGAGRIAAESPPLPGPAGAKPTTENRSRFEILMIEDSPSDSNIIELLLKKERMPFRVHVVKDGEEAIAFLKRMEGYQTAPTPSLILLDLNLPKLDGITVLKELKRDPVLKGIPVIVVTSSGREEDIRASYEMAAACYLKKPRDLSGYRDMLTLLRKFWFDQVQLPPPKGETPARSHERLS
jgi:PAS domain S-box-containing protein